MTVLKPFNCHCTGTGTGYSGGGSSDGGDGSGGSGSGFSGSTINPGCNVCIDKVSPVTYRIDMTATGGACAASYNGAFIVGVFETPLSPCFYTSASTTGDGALPITNFTVCASNPLGGSRFELSLYTIGFGIYLKVFRWDGFANVSWAEYALAVDEDQTTNCLGQLTLTLINGGTDNGTTLGDTCTITAI